MNHALRSTLLLMLALAVASMATAVEAVREFPVSTTVTMGEGESLVDARRQATIELQRQAAARVGTFVEARAELRDGELREAVTEVLAATVALDQVQEEVGVSDGRPALTLKAQARVDMESVERRIHNLREDEVLRRQILQLSRENAELESALATARRQAGQSSLAEVEIAEAKVRIARSRLNQGRDRVRGLVLNLTPVIAEAENVEVELARLFAPVEVEFEEAIIEPLLRAPIEAKVENVRRSLDNRHWIGEVVVRWSAYRGSGVMPTLCARVHCLDPMASLSTNWTRSSHYDRPSMWSELQIRRDTAPGDLPPPLASAYRRALARLWTSTRLVLVVSIGDVRSEVSILNPQDAAVPRPDHFRRQVPANSQVEQGLARLDQPPADTRSRYQMRDPSFDRPDAVTVAQISSREEFRAAFEVPADGGAPPSLRVHLERRPGQCLESETRCSDAPRMFRLAPLIDRGTDGWGRKIEVLPTVHAR